jgi:branched-chain amino acid transport system permease protein
MIRALTPSGVIAIVLLLGALAFPAVAPNNYYLSVMSLAFINALAALGLNLIAGYTGQLNLAHGGFMAIGAYTVGILTVDHGVPYWLAFVAAGLVATALGLVIGLISLRLRQHYFAVFTLCVGTILALVIEKWDALTHGVVGIMDVPVPPGAGPLSFASPVGQYYLVVATLALGTFVMARIVRSLVGRSFVAIRNGEALAQALGINLMRTKVVAFMISTFYAGIAGALYAGYVRFLGPDLANVARTFDMITFTLVGGLGTLAGPILGAVLISWITQSLQVLQDYRMVVFGPLLILLIIYAPHGIVGGLERAFARRRAKRMEAASRAAPLGQEVRPHA